MYVNPQPHKCLRCGYEVNQGQDDTHAAPRVEGNVCCPKCWSDFLKNNIGMMECTVVLNKSGISNYDKSRAEAIDSIDMWDDQYPYLARSIVKWPDSEGNMTVYRALMGKHQPYGINSNVGFNPNNNPDIWQKMLLSTD